MLLLPKYFQLYWIVILRDLRMWEKDYMKYLDFRTWPARVWNTVNSYTFPSCILFYATFHNYLVKDLTTLAISQIQTLSENSAACWWIFESNKCTVAVRWMKSCSKQQKTITTSENMSNCPLLLQCFPLYWIMYS